VFVGPGVGMASITAPLFISEASPARIKVTWARFGFLSLAVFRSIHCSLHESLHQSAVVGFFPKKRNKSVTLVMLLVNCHCHTTLKI
jgi:hypothetical protein